MYGRKEAAQTREAFWTAFGQYMQPVPAAGGGKVNWVNYRTGEKDLYFRMHADQRTASIGVIMAHRDTEARDTEARHSFYEKLLPLRDALHELLEEEWVWELEAHDEHGRSISRIFTETQGVNIMDRSQWPALISFFKPRIIALDAFWESYKDFLIQ
jgi:hypothetical protein